MQQKFTHCYARRSLMALLWLLLPCIYLHAQKSVQPGRNVTITNSHISLRDVFNVIEKQTGVVLFFGDLNTSQLVGVRFVSTPIEEALADMLPPLGLTFEYVKGNKDKIFIRSIVAEKKKDTIMVMSVSGVVLDDKGLPLPGASVRLKGTAFGTATKDNGSFTLSRAGEHDVIQVSYTGFVTAEMPLAGKTSVKVQLKPGDNSLNEMVVTAYGTMEERAVTGAITVVKGAEIQNLPNRSFDKSLQGMVPGLLVTQGTGQPGGGLSNFVLRGIATSASPINGSTVRNPLIIIDGIPVSQETFQMSFAGNAYTTAINNPLSQLNTSDIESISVLKDAAAIALYGAKASNGVILITTKKGKPGKTRIQFRHQTDIAHALNGKNRVLTQQEYLDLLYETYKNTDSEKWTDRTILSDLYKKFPYRVNGTDTSFYPTPDWNKELFNGAASTTSNEVSIVGGNDRSNFYMNVEYTKQNGVLKGTGYDRKSVRFNFENRPASWLKIGINNFLSYNIQDYGGSVAGGGDTYGTEIFLMSPLNPIRLDNGEYLLNFKTGGVIPNQVNPAAALAYNTNRNTAFRGMSKMSAELSLSKHINFISSLGVDFMLAEGKEKVDPRLTDPQTRLTGGKIDEQNTRRSNLINTNIFRYDQVFSGNHALNAIMGQEAQIIDQKTLGLAVTGLESSYYDQINSPGAKIIRQNGYVRRETLLSYFGQLNYRFKDRYFFTGSIRRDGSSRFGADKRFGTYWSTGLGWILTSEPFIKNINTYLSYLKIRGSIGAAGNAGAIDRFTPYDQASMATYMGSTAIYTSSAGNPDIKWENTFTWDAGIEGRVAKDLISFTADIYQRNTSNLIYMVNLPLSSGFSSVLSNIGKMRNRGVEISISADLIRSKDFNWNINANWSTNKNVLVKADVPIAATVTGPIANKEGESFNSFYTVRWAGVNPSNGNGQWIDSTDKAKEDYDAANRVFVGQSQPKGFGAITSKFVFKGIELSAMFYYQYGNLIYDNPPYVDDGRSPYRNQGKRALDRWQKNGDIASNPKRVLSNPYGGPTLFSNRFLFRGDYIRFQNLTIAYNFSARSINTLNIDMMRVFVQGNNLLLWCPFPSKDPSAANVMGVSSSGYPIQRSFSVGLNVGF